ncbi:MAG: CTP-dependent riboflavin kinase, partial [Candidatus Aenigmarchaeota archaeon]|nr:CTP-dependent riboflavin kinase [Candidatus Aenigmarchaeota archaeon]
MKLAGRVKSGVGEGGFFMSLEPYVQEMEKELGYVPYPGTLNMAAEKKDAEAFIKQLKDITIPGFTRGTKTFGAVHCYPCALKGVKVAIIVPEFTR